MREGLIISDVGATDRLIDEIMRLHHFSARVFPPNELRSLTYEAAAGNRPRWKSYILPKDTDLEGENIPSLPSRVEGSKEDEWSDEQSLQTELWMLGANSVERACHHKMSQLMAIEGSDLGDIVGDLSYALGYAVAMRRSANIVRIEEKRETYPTDSEMRQYFQFGIREARKELCKIERLATRSREGDRKELQERLVDPCQAMMAVATSPVRMVGDRFDILTAEQALLKVRSKGPNGVG
jgi:hypothetical protein